LLINNFLIKENIPVFEYIKTASGKYYIKFNNNIYNLMRKMDGEIIKYDNPFIGDYKSTAYNIGFEIARLHKALKKLRKIGNIYESDLMSELSSSFSEIKAHNIDIPCEIIDLCLEFNSEYKLLPRQLIHRDIQFGNMLFENGRLTAFLDFDSSEISVRLFDIAYFGQSILFTNNYMDSVFIRQWIEFFSSFLYGYNSENMLSEIEMKAIYKMCVALQITFISYYLWLKDKTDLAPARVDLAKWIYANESIFNFLV